MSVSLRIAGTLAYMIVVFGTHGKEHKMTHNYQFQPVTLYRLKNCTSRFLVLLCKIMISLGVFKKYIVCKY